MKSIHLITLSCFIGANAFTQKYRISGKVTDAETNQPVENAYVEWKKGGTFTDQEGMFSSPMLPEGKYSVKVKYVGYLVYQQNLAMRTDTTLLVQLSPFANDLDTVVITSKRVADASVNTLSATQIGVIPSVVGERDLVRMMALLPGIKADNDGGSGIYVRGGSADQNLFLLNGAPVYKNSNLLGFFSPFNSDVLEQVDVYKGAFPARFGGRLSSVLDMKLKTASMEKYKVSGSAGIITSRILAELPLVKNRLSVLLAARRSYFDIFTKLFAGAGTNEPPNYYFFDFNGVVSLRVGKKGLWQAFSYQNKDYLTARGDDASETNKYQQTWYSSVVGSSLYLTLSKNIQNFTEGFSSKYQMRLQIDRERLDDSYGIQFKTFLNDFTLRNTTDIQVASFYTLQFGFSHTSLQSNPSEQVYFFNGQPIGGSKFDLLKGQLLGTWIDNTLQVGRLKANIGYRYDEYRVIQQTFKMPQPRVALSYSINEDATIKTSFSDTFQSLHQLSNAGLGFPVDIWLSSQSTIKPQFARQFTFGGQKEIRTYNEGKIQKWLLNAEAYFKTMDNIISYQDGQSSSDFTEFNQFKAGDLSKIITSGRGVSYGVELMAEKKIGKWKGWVSYTLSKTNHQFDVFNNGDWFPARQDQRHHLAVMSNFTLSKRWTINATWTYLTGQAITLPQAVYAFPSFDFSAKRFENYQDLIYTNGSRNAYRMAPYHRLDVSVQRQTTHKWGSGILEISFFNLYNRRNPYFYYLGLGQKVMSVSLFGIIPSISYSFKVYSK